MAKGEGGGGNFAGTKGYTSGDNVVGNAGGYGNPTSPTGGTGGQTYNSLGYLGGNFSGLGSANDAANRAAYDAMVRDIMAQQVGTGHAGSGTYQPKTPPKPKPKPVVTTTTPPPIPQPKPITGPLNPDWGPGGWNRGPGYPPLSVGKQYGWDQNPGFGPHGYGAGQQSNNTWNGNMGNINQQGGEGGWGDVGGGGLLGGSGASSGAGIDSMRMMAAPDMAATAGPLGGMNPAHQRGLFQLMQHYGGQGQGSNWQPGQGQQGQWGRPGTLQHWMAMRRARMAQRRGMHDGWRQQGNATGRPDWADTPGIAGGGDWNMPGPDGRPMTPPPGNTGIVPPHLPQTLPAKPPEGDPYWSRPDNPLAPNGQPWQLDPGFGNGGIPPVKPGMGGGLPTGPGQQMPPATGPGQAPPRDLNPWGMGGSNLGVQGILGQLSQRLAGQGAGFGGWGR
jgi:hypothetical protein